jgi:O-antigen ligase
MTVATRATRLPRLWSTLLGRITAALVTIIAGVVVGLQYISPNRRVIPVLVAIVMFGITWQLSMVTGLGVMILAIPFQRVTVFGSTNLAFVLLLLILWLLRVAQRQSPPPRSTPLDAPVLALFIIYVVSFYNVESRVDLRHALEIFELEAAAMLAYYLVVSNLRTERDLRRLLGFQAVTALLICLVALFELTQPGKPLFPGWIAFGGPASAGINIHEARVGSLFHDFELLSEYCALTSLTILYLFLRAESTTRRVFYAGLLFLVVFVLFATVTRGAFIALGVGGLYLLWHIRRRINFVAAVIVATGLVALVLGLDFYVSHFTRSGSVLGRLGETTFVNMMPEDRAGAWTGAWERAWEHPWIGHGPVYTPQTGLRVWLWPHCLYLFVLNNVGFIGLAIFFWLLGSLFRVSLPRTDDLRHSRFSEGYLLIGHVQLMVFLVDEIKIEYLRNPNYGFQIWLMFALIVAAYQVSRHEAAKPALAPAIVRS